MRYAIILTTALMVCVGRLFGQTSDIVYVAGTASSNINYSSSQAASNLNDGNTVTLGSFQIRDGGAVSDGDVTPTTLTTLLILVGNFQNVRAVAVFDGTTKLAEATVGGTEVQFSGLSIVAPDNGMKTFKIKATFNSLVTDKQPIVITISQVTALGTGSFFAAGNAGGAATPGTSNIISVTATKFSFSSVPVSTLTNYNTTVTVEARDANNNRDLDATNSITLSQLSGGGSISASETLVKNLVQGQVTWTTLQFTSSGSIGIAASGALTQGSVSINVLLALPEPDFASPFSVVGFEPTSITLSFPAPNTVTDCMGYLILRRQGADQPDITQIVDGTNPPSGTLPGNTVVVMSSMAGNAATYTDIGLDPATTYTYALIPFNFNGTDALTYNYRAGSFATTTGMTLHAAPVIVDFVPKTGRVGTLVQITGTGFEEDKSLNAVYFGAVRAEVVSATSISLIVKVPLRATYEPITVTRGTISSETGGLTGRSSIPFQVTFPGDDRLVDFTFYNQLSLTLTTSTAVRRPDPGSVVAADFNADGVTDVAAINPGGTKFSILAGHQLQDNGAFNGRGDFASGDEVTSLAAGDLDGDYKKDIIVSNFVNNSISVFRNNSMSSTPSMVKVCDVLTEGTTVSSVAIADIDGDGRQDIISLRPTDIAINRNIYDGMTFDENSFTSAVTFPFTSTSRSQIVVADLDGDRLPELIVSQTSSPPTVAVYRNVSTVGSITSGSFTGPFTYQVGSDPMGLAVGDIDGDGKLDIAVANYGSRSVSVLRNTSTCCGFNSGSFATNVDFNTSADNGANPVGVVIADVTGDGKPEIIAVNTGTNEQAIFRNTSTSGVINSSSLAAPLLVQTDAPWGSVVADINGDERPDLMAARSYESGTNKMIFAANRQQPPYVSAISPVSGPSLTTLTITGVGFGETVSDNSVLFGSVKGVITEASTTSLKVTVPKGVSYSRATVVTRGLSFTSSQYFSVTNLPAVTLVTENFTSPVELVCPDAPDYGSLAVGDVDGDGKQDIVVLTSSAFSIFKNKSSSGSITTTSFESRVDFTNNGGSGRLKLADIDNDGRLDVLIINPPSANVYIFRNISSTGSITTSSFAGMETVILPEGPHSLDVGDVDGDGMPDIVYAGNSSSAIFIMRNKNLPGSGEVFNFDYARAFTTPSSIPVYPVVADVDSDGKPDIVVADLLAGFVSVFKNQCEIGRVSISGFATRVDFSIPGSLSVSSLSVGDLDGDGKTDIVGAQSDGIFVLRNTTTTGVINISSFATRQLFSFGSPLSDIVIADLDGNTFPEVIGSSESNPELRILPNSSTVGSISFSARVNLPDGGLYPGAVCVADMDGDGLVDVLSKGKQTGSSYNVAIHRGTGLPDTTPPEIQSLEPVDNTTDLPTNITQLVVTFTEPVKAGNGNVNIKRSSGTDFSLISTVSLTITDNKLIVPVTDLSPNESYYVLIDAGAITDMSGSAFAGISDPTTWNFTISVDADLTAPMIQTLQPVDNAVDVPFNISEISLTFNETIKKGTGSITLRWGDSHFSSIGMENVTVSENVLTLPLSGGLHANENYYVLLDDGAIKDVANNTFSGITDPTTWNFSTGNTTDVTAPVIDSLNPADNAVDVPTTTSQLVLIFNEPVKKGTGNVTIYPGSAASFNVSITSAVVSGTTVTVPIAGLSSNTNYSVQIDGTAIIDVNGNAFAGISDQTTWNFSTPGAPIVDNTPPVVAPDINGAIPAGVPIDLSVIATDQQSPITSVVVEYRSISDGPGTYTSKTLTLSAADADTYVGATIPVAEIGPLGIEYRIIATSAGGTKTDSYRQVKLDYNFDGGLTIPYSAFGAGITNYRIIAIPLDLPSKTVSNVFTDDLQDRTLKSWRVGRYENGTNNQDYSGTMVPGQGYWLITRSNIPADTGPGTTVAVNLTDQYKLSLAQGWNLIGNPFNFALVWSDVQAANTGDAVPGITVYPGSYSPGSRLAAFEGAFINMPAARTITIPVKRNTSSRINSDPSLTNPIDGDDWEVAFRLTQGGVASSMPGVGMRKRASVDFDVFDYFTPPRLDEFLELNHTRKFNGTNYARDIVPTEPNHTWNFIAETSNENQPITIQWDNSYFGDNEQQLVLWDETQQLGIDMRDVSSYVFNPRVSRVFKVIYGNREFINEKTRVESLVFHDVYPNPTQSDATIAFSIPTRSQASVEVFDMIGNRSVIFSGELPQGYNKVAWKNTGSSGMYIVRVASGGEVKLKRLIVN